MHTIQQKDKTMTDKKQTEYTEEEQVEFYFRNFTTSICNILQSCLTDQFPVMDQKLREQFLREQKTLKRNMYKIFDLDWNKDKRETKGKR